STPASPLSLHDALPISRDLAELSESDRAESAAAQRAAPPQARRGPFVRSEDLLERSRHTAPGRAARSIRRFAVRRRPGDDAGGRSEEHTSELQSRGHLV